MTETLTTESVLEGMLKENTGRHMLDSGGAYGRAWEKNQGENFGDHPEVTVDWEVYPSKGATWEGAKDRTPELTPLITLDLYHFLRRRLDFLPELQAKLDAYAETEPDESWHSIAQGFAEKLIEDGDAEAWEGTGQPQVVNTYNHESLLSQVIEFRFVSDPDESEAFIVILQVHGGCDVRGGYTAPKVFRAYGYDFLDDGPERVEFYCTNDKCRNDEGRMTSWWEGGHSCEGNPDQKALQDYPVEHGTEGKVGTVVVDEDANKAFCPVCGTGELAVEPPFTEGV